MARHRLGVFIDGFSLHTTAKSLGFEVDYRRLLDWFRARGQLIRASFYTTVVYDQDFSSVRPLLDWLSYNGYAVVSKPVKESVDSSGRRRFQGRISVEMAVDALEMSAHMDEMILFSGDGDFRGLVEAVQRRGVRVSVVSTIASQPPMIAEELRRQADDFVDILQIVDEVGRPAPVERRPARAAVLAHDNSELC